MYKINTVSNLQVFGHASVDKEGVDMQHFDTFEKNNRCNIQISMLLYMIEFSVLH